MLKTEHLRPSGRKLALLAAGVLLMILAATVWAGLRAKAALERYTDPVFISSFLSDTLKCPTSVKKVSWKLPGTLVLEECVVSTPEALKKQGKVMAVPRVIILIDIWKAAGNDKDSAVRLIELEKPDMLITGEFIDFIKDREKKEKPWKNLPSLRVESGSLTWLPGGGASPWSFKNIKGNLEKKGEPREVRISCTSEDTSEKWSIRGAYPVEKGKGLTLQGKNVPLLKLAALFPTREKITYGGKTDLEAHSESLEEWDGVLESALLSANDLSLEKFHLKFGKKASSIEIPEIRFVIWKGAFSGRGHIDTEKTGPVTSVEGACSGIDLVHLEKYMKASPLKGALSLSLSLRGTKGRLVSRGAFEIGKGTISFMPFEGIKGNYVLENRKVSFRDTMVKTSQGDLSLNGAADGGTLDAVAASSAFKPELKEDFLLPLSFPRPGAFHFHVLGKPGEYRGEGKISFPSLLMGKKTVNNPAVSGKIRQKGNEYLFDRLDISLGGKSFGLSGKIKKDKDLVLDLENIRPELIFALMSMKTGPSFFSAEEGAACHLEASEKATRGRITLGKGALVTYPFSSMTLDFNAPARETSTISGSIKGKEEITLEGTIRKKVLSLKAAAKSLTAGDWSVIKPQLTLTARDGAALGEISAFSMTFAKETMKAPLLKFTESRPSEFVISGSARWNGNPIDIRGSIKNEAAHIAASSKNIALESLRLNAYRIPALKGSAEMKITADFKGKTKEWSMQVFSREVSLGGRKYKPLLASISAGNDEVEIEQIRIGDKVPLITGKGSLKKGMLSLRGQVNNFPVEALETPGENAQGPSLNGMMTGEVSVEGSLKSPEFSFSGSGSELSYDKKSLGGGKISLAGRKDTMAGTFEPALPDRLISSFISSKGELFSMIGKNWGAIKISFHRKGKEPAEFEGASSHKEMGRVSIQGAESGKGLELALKADAFPLKTLTLIEPELHVVSADKKISGTVTAPRAKTENDEISSLNFTFSQKEDEYFPFSGEFTIAESKALVTGQSRGGAFEAAISVPRLNLAQWALSKLQEQKLKGTARIEISVNKGGAEKNLFSLSSSDLIWDQNKLPKVTCEGAEKEGLYLISALKVFAGDSPIVLTGSMAPKKKTCQLGGRIEGVPITTLAGIMGGKRSDMEGKVLGDLKVSGDPKDPDFSYEGRVLGLAYRGKSMGDGTLKLKGNGKAIDGRLDLDNAPKYRIGVPYVSALSTEVGYYFKLEGSPRNFVIRPQLSTSRFNLDPSLIWGVFRKAD
ncbi:MAG: hypothetical protein RDV48_26625 [Candidatus Eremiobacteraeota bacterium]|nr:hypothetical protein [Candidatus Eremiobacteraeota bacterium]